MCYYIKMKVHDLFIATDLHPPPQRDCSETCSSHQFCQYLFVGAVASSVETHYQSSHVNLSCELELRHSEERVPHDQTSALCLRIHHNNKGNNKKEHKKTHTIFFF